MLECIDALIEVFGAGRVAARFSPTGRFNDMYDSDPIGLMKYALKELEKRNIAFVEVKRHGALDYRKYPQGQTTDEKGRVLPKFQIPDFYKTIRSLYGGVLVANDAFDVDSAKEIIRDGYADIVSFGSLAIGNPDLSERIKNGWEINKNLDMNTFYTSGAEGYTDYPFYDKNNNDK